MIKQWCSQGKFRLCVCGGGGAVTPLEMLRKLKIISTAYESYTGNTNLDSRKDAPKPKTEPRH